MHRIIVEEKSWIGENRFLQALNYCMLLPGPEAQQLAIYIGWLMHKTKGGLFAGTLFVLPGLLAIMALSWIYVLLGNVTHRAGPVLRPEGGGAGRSCSRRCCASAGARSRTASCWRWPPPPSSRSSSSMCRSRSSCWRRPHRLRRRPRRAAAFPQRRRATARSAPSRWPTPIRCWARRRPSMRGPTCAGRCRSPRSSWRSGWCRSLALYLSLGGDNVFTKIAIFFSKMAVVTFGGAYAVLAYVAQQAVDNYHWLTAGRDAGRARHGRDDARPADHGHAVRRLPRPPGASPARCRPCSRRRWAGCSPPG